MPWVDIRLSNIYEDVVLEILASDDPSLGLKEMSNSAFASYVMSKTRARIDRVNAHRTSHVPKLRKLVEPLDIHPSQVAHAIIARDHVVSLKSASTNSEDYMLLAAYQSEGPRKGLYSSVERDIARLLYSYLPTLSVNEYKLLMQQLKTLAPIVYQEEDKDLVPMNNGIFNYRTKELLPFSPDLVFTAKSGVDLDFDAQMPVLYGPGGEIFEFHDWLLDLFDDDLDRVRLIYQIIGAVLRPLVQWNKAAFFYSTVGSNGKGTIVRLLRALVGESWTDIPLNRLGQDFMLESLIGSTAIITDENDVGTYIDKAANLKAIITGDSVLINRKGRPAIKYSFDGFMVQCLNEMPKIRDKTSSMIRRMLFVAFDKSFIGKEKFWIKEEMMVNVGLLEALAKYVLCDMDTYYKLDSDNRSLELLTEFQMKNDPVRDFWDEMSSQFAWDLIPTAFLYDLYVAWTKRVNPSGKAVSRSVFLDSLKPILEHDVDWVDKTSRDGNPIRTGSLMSTSEPLIVEFDLWSWKNPTYQGTDEDKIATPKLLPRYRGIVRK